MSGYTIYHNPRCSKSRQTLALLEENGVKPEVVLYLETPPDETTLAGLVRKLGLSSASELLRTREKEYKEAGLSPDSSDKDVIRAMARYPKLIERPVVVKGRKAVLGRPPENALALIKE